MKKKILLIPGHVKWNRLVKKFQKVYNRLRHINEGIMSYEKSRLMAKLKSIYHRLQKMQCQTGVKLAGTTLALMLTVATANAQITFTEKTGINNPFNSSNALDGIDIGAHSAPTFIDIDNDGDMDAFIGEYDRNINFYENIGTNESPTFTEQTGNDNPLNGVDVGDNSAPTFIDIDNDGDMDAFIGGNIGNINFYENTGTNESPTFTEQTGNDNPFNGVDVGNSSALTFADIDNDGDMDAFVGEWDGNINFYENTGTNESPTFTEQTGNDNPFNGVDVGHNSVPIFEDIDNDGDLDAFIGEYVGNINFYENTGTNESLTFTEQTGNDNPFNGVDVGTYSAPTFADIDNDGDMDAFIGERSGSIKFYENIGNSTSASFVLASEAVDIVSYSVPTFADIDNDGDMDAFIGEYYGSIKFYKNTGTNESPSFTEQTDADNPLNGVDVGSNSAPIFADIDNDGDMDAFIGERSGAIIFYKNTGTNESPTFTEQTGNDNPFNGVYVGYSAAPTFADIDNDGDMDAFIGDDSGSINFYKNTGTNESPTFTEQTGNDNPFNGVDVGDDSYPTFVDIDNDGDIDAFIGDDSGSINFYKNTGANESPMLTEQTGDSNPFNGVDVGSNSVSTFVDIDNDGDMDAFIGEKSGDFNFYENTNSNPIITASQSFTVTEDAANETLVGTVVATDEDANTTFSDWSITDGNNEGIFAIDASTGEITIADNTNLDYETASSYTLTLTVSDGTNTSVAETVTVIINDVNDAPELTAVATDLTVDEDNTLTLSMDNVTANDVDGDELSLVISAGDNYTVDGLVITPATNFNGTLTVPVAVTDGTATSETMDMSITVNAATAVAELLAVNVNVYPNPASELIHIALPEGVDHATIVLYNAIGVKQMEMEAQSNVANMNIANLPQGIYVFKITVNNQNSILRWVKE